VTGSADQTVRVWDLETTKCLGSISGFNPQLPFSLGFMRELAHPVTTYSVQVTLLRLRHSSMTNL